MAPPAGRSRSLPGWRSLVLFIAVAVLLDYQALPDPAHRLFDPWTDPAQTTWFFSYVAHALFSGHNPLVTNYLQYPSGINLMWNAAMPLLGVLAAPVTLTLGPVVSYHLVLVGGMALTAWTTRLWLGRHVGAAAAIVGGLLFAFSPYSTGQAVYHVGQAVLPFIPLMLMLLEDLLWRRPRRQWISGLLLGAALAGQMLINSETALIALIGTAVAAVAALVLRPGSVRLLRGTVLGWIAAAAAFLLIAGGPMWQQFRGPHRFHSLVTAMYVAEPRDWVEPTPHLLLNWAHRTPELLARGLGEHEVGGYFGVPLLLLLLAITILLRRRLEMWIGLLSLLGITLLSLGPRLRLGADLVGPPLPGRVLTALPVVRNVLPVRLSMAGWLAAAFLVALAVDAAVRLLAGRTRALALLAVAASLVPLLPAGLPSGFHTDVPAFFTGSAAKQIPAGSAVAILPYPETDRARPLLWTAEAGARWRLVGGAAKHPGPDGVGVAPPPTTPITRWARDVTNGRTPGPHQSANARNWARAHSVRYVLVVLAYFPADTVAKTNRLVGHGPDTITGGVAVWKVG